MRALAIRSSVHREPRIRNLRVFVAVGRTRRLGREHGRRAAVRKSLPDHAPQAGRHAAPLGAWTRPRGESVPLARWQAIGRHRTGLAPGADPPTTARDQLGTRRVPLCYSRRVVRRTRHRFMRACAIETAAVDASRSSRGRHVRDSAHASSPADAPRSQREHSYQASCQPLVTLKVSGGQNAGDAFR